MTSPDHPPTATGPASSPQVPVDLTAHNRRAEEHDLWEFEAPEPLNAFPDPVEYPRPVARGFEKKQVRPVVRFATPEVGGAEGVTKINFAKIKSPASPPIQTGHEKPGQDFDDLDSWEVSQPDRFVIRVSPDLQPPPAVAPPEESPAAAAKPAGKPPATTGDITLLQLASRVNLSFFEYCGLALLLGLLTAGGITIYFYTLHRLPTKSPYAVANNFPVQGEHLAIVSASSYWRAPGPGDTARRGTQLLPVLVFKSTGGPASIRVLFRDGNGILIGDAVTQPMKNGDEVEISATAGFEDRGMHAGYRTGQDPSWTIEICEAAAGKFTGADFKKLLTIPVSTLSR